MLKNYFILIKQDLGSAAPSALHCAVGAAAAERPLKDLFLQTSPVAIAAQSLRPPPVWGFVKRNVWGGAVNP